MDILNPFGDEPEKSPGEEMVSIAGELARFVKSMGGPDINETALATVLVDIRAWWLQWH